MIPPLGVGGGVFASIYGNKRRRRKFYGNKEFSHFFLRDLCIGGVKTWELGTFDNEFVHQRHAKNPIYTQISKNFACGAVVVVQSCTNYQRLKHRYKNPTSIQICYQYDSEF